MNSIDLQLRLFKKYFKPIRLYAGLTQDEAADMIGVSKPTIISMDHQYKVSKDRYYAYMYLLENSDDRELRKLFKYLVVDENIAEEKRDLIANGILWLFSSIPKRNGMSDIKQFIRENITMKEGA